MRIFLSHSSKDKAVVRRVNRDLRSSGFNTWIDEDDIPFGGSITQYIEKGLDDSDVLMAFLSKHAVLSKWLETEWQSKFFEQVNKDEILVIPILLEECEIPKLLEGRRYADFSKKEQYETNLSRLLRQLQKAKQEKDSSYIRKPRIDSVFDYTAELLEELEEETISLPVHNKLPIIETLKKIPRSGKKVRLYRFKTTVRVRSIYDHILSMAHVADCLLPYINHGVRSHEYAELSRCIAFHELNEVVLGDIPTYTSMTARTRNRTRNYAEQQLRSILPEKRERIANDLIWMFLSEKQRMSMEAVSSHLEDDESNLYVLFKVLDKIDPIIATWRYLHVYRNKLGETPKEFLKKMKDFFENPDVKLFLQAKKVDAKLYGLVAELQNRRNAWAYYLDPSSIFQKEKIDEFPKDVVRQMIEGVPLFHDGQSR